MRVLFAGTPALAVPSLRAVAHAHDVVGVLTAPDKPAGRGRTTSPPPVAVAARDLALSLLQPAALNADVIARVRQLAPDILVVVAYGKIFREPFLSLFRLGGINLHPSLLPRYRGPTPITAAILAGDRETGVTIQRLALKFDTGDILAQSRHALAGDETTGSLSDTLAGEGAELLKGVLAAFAEGRPPAGRAQDEASATYCSRLSKEDGIIDWGGLAVAIERQVRAFAPWPRACTTLHGETLLVLKTHVAAGTLSPDASRANPGDVLIANRDHGLLVRTGDGILAVERVQPQFKKPQDWRSFLNGHPDVVGSRLGT
jgi:methionyl-tRNA formyltransferase